MSAFAKLVRWYFLSITEGSMDISLDNFTFLHYKYFECEDFQNACDALCAMVDED